MSTVDPLHIGGFMGNGSSWFTATGLSTTAPDGSIAWEYRSPYDTEPIWANWFSAPRLEAPRYHSEPLYCESRHIVIDPAPPVKAEVPEPASWLLVLIGICVCLGVLRWSNRRRWNG